MWKLKGTMNLLQSKTEKKPRSLFLFFFAPGNIRLNSTIYILLFVKALLCSLQFSRLPKENICIVEDNPFNTVS